MVKDDLAENKAAAPKKGKEVWAITVIENDKSKTKVKWMGQRCR